MLRNRTFNKQSGFTLVEMAIVLIIFGMMTSIAMAALKYYTGRQASENTAIALDFNDAGLFTFQATMRRYPCPADPKAQPNDANYGIEDCTNASGNIVTVAGRDTNGDGVGDPVLTGAIPFNTLLDMDNDPLVDMNLDNDPIDSVSDDYIAAYGYDGWGNKLTYSVTAALADPNLIFDQDAGAISIVDEQNDNLLEIDGTAHYAIISHGQNGVGAYNRNGDLVQPCANGMVAPPTGPPTTTVSDETQNCNYNLNATYLNGIYSESRNHPYDDYIKYATSKVSTLWSYTQSMMHDNNTPGNPADDYLINRVVNQNGGNVGVGTKNPQEKLHVIGNVQAQQIHANSLCPENGDSTLCMPVDTLAGELPNMRCATAGEVVVSIDQNAVKCANPFTSMPAGTCPYGYGMVGISSKTGPICQQLF
jgi:prepilin-type N-terminal cleavage/methylation domain-containing protein